MRSVLLPITLVAALFAPRPLAAQAEAEDVPDPLLGHAVLHDASGEEVGTVDVVQTPHYGVHLRVRLHGVPPGEHAFHLHETGRCDAPDFGSAGGHYAPRGHDHGVLHPTGKHAGDLPNVHVPASGDLSAEYVATGVSLRDGVPTTLFDGDGSAVVIHEGSDDYRSQPSGAAGPRIACGVVGRGPSGR